MNGFQKYTRPAKTYQETLSKEEIKEKLKGYVQVSDISTVPIGTHLRYFMIDKDNEKHFRTGGILQAIDPKQRYVKLSNGTVTWSAQIPNAIFYKKQSEDEYRNSIEQTIAEKYKKEIYTLQNKIVNLQDRLVEFDELKKNYRQLKK